VNLIDVRANLLGASDVLADAALDKYSFVRNAYLQRRQYLISGGDGSTPDYGEEALPTYDDTASGGTAGAAAATAASATATPLAPASATAAPATAASAPEAASEGAEAPGAASGSSTIKGNQMVPPRIPSFPSIRLR
jgi:phospholipid-binding lipoprotein MlaA